MKKAISLLILLVMTLTFAVACTPDSVQPVVIQIPQGTDSETLLEYMDSLQEKGELSFTIADGMITSLNGTENTSNTYWMLYTSDTEYANNAWGTFSYEGNDYGSATLGADSLPIKEGCYYIWAYQKF